jgi:hypothetical protein
MLKVFETEYLFNYKLSQKTDYKNLIAIINWIYVEVYLITQTICFQYNLFRSLIIKYIYIASKEGLL